jgi:hypothetical protein
VKLSLFFHFLHSDWLGDSSDGDDEPSSEHDDAPDALGDHEATAQARSEAAQPQSLMSLKKRTTFRFSRLCLLFVNC